MEILKEELMETLMKILIEKVMLIRDGKLKGKSSGIYKRK